MGTCLVVSACTAQGKRPLRASEQAPDFTLKDFSGREYSLRQFKGKVIFVDFWASWCPPCVASAPKVEDIYHAYKERDDFMVIGINLDVSSQQAQNFISERKITYLILQGGQSAVSRDYGVRGIPTFFLIDAEGKT